MRPSSAWSIRIGRRRSKIIESSKTRIRTATSTARSRYSPRGAGRQASRGQARGRQTRSRADRAGAPALRRPCGDRLRRHTTKCQSGQQVGQSLMAVRSLGGVSVDANFKETQLRHLRIGHRYVVAIDRPGVNDHLIRGSVSRSNSRHHIPTSPPRTGVTILRNPDQVVLVFLKQYGCRLYTPIQLFCLETRRSDRGRCGRKANSALNPSPSYLLPPEHVFIKLELLSSGGGNECGLCSNASPIRTPAWF